MIPAEKDPSQVFGPWQPLGEQAGSFPPTIRTYVDRCWDKADLHDRLFIERIRAIYYAAVNSRAPGAHSYVSKSVMWGLGTPGMASQKVEHEAGWHVFCGGHVVVQDNGDLYREWAGRIVAGKGQLKGARRDGRLSGSSHYKMQSKLQYEVHLPGLGCVLFGTTGENAGHHTWFQNESWEGNKGSLASFDGWGRTVAHGVLGFGVHKFNNNRQVGAIGLSDYSEKPPHMPLILAP